MKNLLSLLALGILIGGCASYPSVTNLGNNHVAVVKTYGPLGSFFIGPQVFVCKTGKKGLSNCASGQNP